MPADPGCGKFRISCAARPGDGRRSAAGRDPLPEIQRLREENLSLQAERQMLLAELGLPDNALEDTPLCPFCNDTGYRGGEMCRCLKTYYVEEQRKELSSCWIWATRALTPLTPTGIPTSGHREKTKSAREHMEWVYDTCVEYAHNFGKKPANLLLFGRPGLGKTHLSAAIAREVSGKGFSVVYDTAGHILSGSRRRNSAGMRQSGTWSGC